MQNISQVSNTVLKGVSVIDQSINTTKNVIDKVVTLNNESEKRITNLDQEINKFQAE